VRVRDQVVLVNNVTALNKLASEIGRDAVKVIFQYALFHVRIFETDNNLAWW
jgi:hypothetical protein